MGMGFRVEGIPHLVKDIEFRVLGSGSLCAGFRV